MDKTADELAYERYNNGEYSYQDYLDVCEQEECEPKEMVEQFKIVPYSFIYPYAVVFKNNPMLCVKVCYTESEALEVKNDYELNYPTTMTEIFKEHPEGLVRMEEVDLIKQASPEYRFHTDIANGYVAFALAVTRKKADELVNELNKITDCWFLGDENEEYVFID